MMVFHIIFLRVRFSFFFFLLTGNLLLAEDALTVGKTSNQWTILPVNQRLTPIGTQVPMKEMRPNAIALSPDGKLLAIGGARLSKVRLVNPDDFSLIGDIPLPPEPTTNDAPGSSSPNNLLPDTKGQISFTGLIFSHDGTRLYFANVDGSVKVFSVDGVSVKPLYSLAIPLANAPRRKKDIPAGLALSPDDKKIYVCGNLSNLLYEIDVTTGKVLRSFKVGVAPLEVVLSEGKAWVSDWGGRRPETNDLTGPAGQGTLVRVDPLRFIANEGALSVIDLKKGTVSHIPTGLHTCALVLSRDEKYLLAANSGSDHISVVDTKTQAVLKTICAKPSPAELLGATPNALAFSKEGTTLYVANGTQNAVAVFSFDPKDADAQILGLLPVGWFPGSLINDPNRKQLIVGNMKGLQTSPKPAGKNYLDPTAPLYNSRQFEGSLSFIPHSAITNLPLLAQQVWDNLRQDRILASALPPRKGVQAVPIPERMGEPSTIKHVVYIIKENKTYDQILGDLPNGNGYPGICVFGSNITPNQHSIANQFVLLDNTYCCGILSADGHQWSDTAFGNDYLERSFAGFPRSYPDGMGDNEADALAYSSAGFIWDNALRHGITIRNYGEFMNPAVTWKDPSRKGKITISDSFSDWRGNTSNISWTSKPLIESLRKFSPTNYIGWSMNVPDQARADYFLKELAEFETKGELPRFIIICLPNDHGSGATPGMQSPAAAVADNDLAFGRILDGLSHSSFWKDMVVFAIEDDPQGGWDHVSGYRTTAYLAGPFVKRNSTISTRYNTTSILRTIEQILGLPPMNSFDASALPMFDCFSEKPDFTPFTALPALYAIDEINPQPKKTGDLKKYNDALASSKMDFSQSDRIPDAELNLIVWRMMRGREPFPYWAVQIDHGD